MRVHLLLGERSWPHQPGERLGPTLNGDGAQLDAPGSQSDARPSDEDEQGLDGPVVVSLPAALLLGEPELNAVREAELVRTGPSAGA